MPGLARPPACAPASWSKSKSKISDTPNIALKSSVLPLGFAPINPLDEPNSGAIPESRPDVISSSADGIPSDDCGRVVPCPVLPGDTPGSLLDSLSCVSAVLSSFSSALGSFGCLDVRIGVLLRARPGLRPRCEDSLRRPPALGEPLTCGTFTTCHMSTGGPMLCPPDGAFPLFGRCDPRGNIIGPNPGIPLSATGVDGAVALRDMPGIWPSSSPPVLETCCEICGELLFWFCSVMHRCCSVIGTLFPPWKYIELMSLEAASSLNERVGAPCFWVCCCAITRGEARPFGAYCWICTPGGMPGCANVWPCCERCCAWA